MLPNSISYWQYQAIEDVAENPFVYWTEPAVDFNFPFLKRWNVLFFFYFTVSHFKKPIKYQLSLFIR